MYDVFKGDIVAVIKPTYIDFPGGRWVDHFVDKKVYFMAIESASNNGNFKNNYFKYKQKSCCF